MPDAEVEETVEVAAYGLHKRERVRSLIDCMGERVPCLPLAIFTVDRMGRLLAIVAMCPDGRKKMHYVKVRRWAPSVVIDWTLIPQSLGRRVKGDADRAIREHTSTLRKPPMRLLVNQLDHAKKAHTAS